MGFGFGFGAEGVYFGAGDVAEGVGEVVEEVAFGAVVADADGFGERAAFFGFLNKSSFTRLPNQADNSL